MRRPLTYSLVAAVLALGLTASLGACAKKPNPSASSTTGTDLGEPGETPSPGDAVSPAAAPSPPAPVSSPASSPSPAPGGGGTSGTPHSTIASKAGFVWVYNAGSSYVSNTPYSYTSSGGPINVAHNGTGSYTVTFGGLGDSGGIAQAQAYGANANYCAISSWLKGGADESVSVRCYDAGGSPVDTQFVTSFAVGSQGSARFAYVWANSPTATSAYHPAENYRYDAVNSAGITVKRTSTGRYEVYLPTAGPELTDPWNVQITAYGSSSLCKLVSLSVANRKAFVACRTAGGANVDSRFSLTFSSEASFIGRGDRRYGGYDSGGDGVTNPSTGNYSVRAAELGQARGQVAALARGTSSTYCHVKGWGTSGADMTMNIVCFVPGGIAASASFLVGVTW
jgi:hypothetical protein